MPGTVVQIGGAQVWGGSNVPSQMPGPASRLYAQNVVNILTLMTAADGGGGFAPDFEDEIVSSTCVTRAGEITHAPTRELLEVPMSDVSRVTAMSEGMVWLTIFVLSVFVGIEVISKVSSTLHTPLMSGANAIHGIILLGAILVTGTSDSERRARRRAGRDRARDAQPGRRLRGHRPHAARCSRGREGQDPADDPDLGAGRLSRRRGLLHPRAQGPVVAQDRADRAT